MDFFVIRNALWRFASPLLQVIDDRLQTEVAGIGLSNPLALAAGYDKDCRFLSSILDMGFGYVVGGTVTLNPRPGNPGPRLVRLTSTRAILNALGFPSRGVDYTTRRLEAGTSIDKPVVVSVAGLTIEEYIECHRRVEPFANAVELNISSPNTQGLKQFQEPRVFRELVDRISDGRRKPLFVKLPPMSGPQTRENVLEILQVCVQSGVDAITAINTRPTVSDKLKMGVGGLSGRPVFEDMLRDVAEIRSEVGNRLAINACGGIFDARDAWKALEAGADSLQLLTGLVYEGPLIASSINRGILRRLEENGFSNLKDYLSSRKRH